MLRIRSFAVLPSDPPARSEKPLTGLPALDRLVADPGVGFEMRALVARNGVWSAACERACGLGCKPLRMREVDDDDDDDDEAPAEGSHSRARGGDGGSGIEAA
jgi:hypothetical protein